MAAIETFFAEQETEQSETSTTTFTNISGASLSGFTAGKKYLILVIASVTSSAGTLFNMMQVAHGGTGFADSEQRIRADASTRMMYEYFTVWTAVSGESITLQMKINVAGTTFANRIQMFAMNLSDNVTENTDWYYAEDASDASLTTTRADRASITFTPATAGRDWLVMSYGQIDATSNTVLYSSSTVLGGVEQHPQHIVTPLDTAEFYSLVSARPFNLTGSQTFAHGVKSIGSNAQTVLHSRCFALDLGKFSQSVTVYSAGPTNLSALDYSTQVQTASLTPSATRDVVIIAFTLFDRQNAAREGEFRLQTDNVDTPANQTTNNYQYYSNRNAGDAYGWMILTQQSLNATPHTFDLDGSSDSTTGTPTTVGNSIIAFTTELAAAGAFKARYYYDMAA